ncbi:hypothetical protein GCM10027044_26510 [Hymenobacter ruber]
MREVNSGWLALLLVLVPTASHAQTLHVQVRDSLRHEALIGASVVVPGTSIGAATDATGTAATGRGWWRPRRWGQGWRCCSRRAGLKLKKKCW